MKCDVDECGGLSRNKGPGLCHKHYMRKRKHGSTEINRTRHLDWSVPQFCSHCKEQMRSQKDTESKLVAHASNGRCRNCHASKRINGLATRVQMFFDVSGQVCTACRVYKEYSHFVAHKSTLSRYNTICKRCIAIMKYGITLADYESLLESQQYKCAICFSSVSGSMNVDHDHSCCPGQKSCGSCVRGLLCGPCNSGIGYLKDNTSILMSAIDYLEKQRKTIE